MGNIIVLPEEVSKKIAAGEVIEGPYSVVRELLDNALDAGASFISAVINNGGKDYILVADDGSGMSEEDALLSVQKHTTSKIQSAQDLLQVNTMGFRGEALSSICTVSDFTMVTKREEDGHGTKVVTRFGKSVHAMPEAANKGTAVTVKNLFGNLPARRKFLKSNRAEAAKVKEEIIKKALSFYDRGFSFKSDDRGIYTLQPASVIRERIADIFGHEVGESLIGSEITEEGYSLRGLVSNRTRSLPNRSGQYFFVNRRPVTDRAMLAAVGNPARAFFPAGRFPYVFLFIEIESDLIDVNVHPQKKEIRIKIMQRLFSSIRALVEETLGMRSGEAAGLDRIGRSGDEYKQQVLLVRERSPVHVPYTKLSGEAGSESQGAVAESAELKLSELKLSKSDIDALEFRGALFKTYLLFEAREYVLVVDQHAAHERVYYERFKKEKRTVTARKSLLIPITFTPPSACYEALLEGMESFGKAGIEIVPFGEDSFAVVEIPGIIPDQREEETISLLLEEICSGNLSPTSEQISDRFLKIAACRAAVKEGDDLSEDEAFRLLEDLRSTEVPYMCPHGRPTAVRRSKGYIERLFGRR